MAAFGTAGTTFGGFVIDRETFRRLLPDDRWVLYAAGFVNPNDGNTATISLVYQKNDGTLVTLPGAITQSGGGLIKRVMGPVDLYASPGVPAENIPVVRIHAAKNAGVDGELFSWTLWLRLLPGRQ